MSDDPADARWADPAPVAIAPVSLSMEVRPAQLVALINYYARIHFGDSIPEDATVAVETKDGTVLQIGKDTSNLTVVWREKP